MNFTVLKTFRDKNTLKSHKTGQIYQTDDLKRVDELQSKGWIGEEVQEVHEAQKDFSVLEQNVANVKQTITAEFSQESLKTLLEQEVAGENRKGVIDHIQSLLKDND